MGFYSRDRTPEEHRRVSLPQIAREIDRTPKQTAKLLAKVGFVPFAPEREGRVTTYDAEALEVLKAMLDIPHRTAGPDDWLGDYLGKAPHA